MSVVSIKPGVRLEKLSAQMALAHVVVASVFAEYGYDCVITSGSDGTHMVGSKHYEGDALDYRLRNCTPRARPAIRTAVANRLSDCYDVVLSGTGSAPVLHVEYDPK